MRRVLLDENMPGKLTQLFAEGVEAQTVGQRGWKGKQNGELLRAAQDEFDVLLTIDQGIPHQQNVGRFKIGIILIEARSNRFTPSSAASAFWSGLSPSRAVPNTF